MSRYLVQIGRYKSAYKTRWSFDSYNQAVLYFNGLNTWDGYKKRLIDTETKTVIARVIS